MQRALGPEARGRRQHCGARKCMSVVMVTKDRRLCQRCLAFDPPLVGASRSMLRRARNALLQVHGTVVEKAAVQSPIRDDLTAKKLTPHEDACSRHGCRSAALR